MFKLIKKHLFSKTDTPVDSQQSMSVAIVDQETVQSMPQRSWHARLRAGLARTSKSLATLFTGTRVDDDLLEEIETALICADVGMDATQNLMTILRREVKSQKADTPNKVKQLLRTLLIDLLKPLEKTLTLGEHQPLVLMIAGVNGAGKTTSIGKLCKYLQTYRQSVLLAAGDTFRAAAREQLARWGERHDVSVIAQEGNDPAAVAFDAIHAAQARQHDVVIIDTAGRLPTQANLMEELKKIRRVAAKAMPHAPHERWLVIDANNGQNALAQVKAFDDALALTGLIVTKLDGTARGGILAAIAQQRPIPVYFIGVGEQAQDLQPFVAEVFADALLGDLSE